ncbi:MAG: bifunctional nuclease family protein [Candidatus Aenigmarchaeota archaeon]|nr:bifunctional nuclease family protein [Candidatus Aenigmarchaeota archaeon]
MKSFRYKYKRKKINYFILLMFGISILSFLLGFYISTLFYKGPSEYIPKILKPNISLEGYSRAKISAEPFENYGIVEIRSGCYRIIAYTEPSQALSIKNGLKGVIEFRPNSHDLIKEIFDYLGIKVLAVKINEVRNNTYFGELIIQEGNKVLSLDARPSDATAIAVRVKAPIYIKNNLLEKYGEKVC